MELKGKQKPEIHKMVSHVIKDDPTSFASDFRKIVKERISQKIIDRKNQIVQDVDLGITEGKSEDDQKSVVSAVEKRVKEMGDDASEKDKAFAKGLRASLDKGGISKEQFIGATNFLKGGK
ncbi:MAG: hypothetical protein ACFFKA_21205 [Candidatus Thorarchaeota archaeon]